MKPSYLTGLLAGLGMAGILFFVGGVLHAQGGAPSDCCVATIDVGKVFNEYQRMKDVTEELKQLQDRLQAENEQRRQQADALEATLNNMDPDDPAYVKKMNELLEARISHKTWFEVKQAHVSREIAVATDRIYRDILKATEEVARSIGYELVLYKDEYVTLSNPDDIQAQMQSRKVVYASQAVDITQLVLDKLNADYRATTPTPQLQVP